MHKAKKLFYTRLRRQNTQIFSRSCCAFSLHTCLLTVVLFLNIAWHSFQPSISVITRRSTSDIQSQTGCLPLGFTARHASRSRQILKPHCMPDSSVAIKSKSDTQCTGRYSPVYTVHKCMLIKENFYGRDSLTEGDRPSSVNVSSIEQKAS